MNALGNSIQLGERFCDVIDEFLFFEQLFDDPFDERLAVGRFAGRSRIATAKEERAALGVLGHFAAEAQGQDVGQPRFPGAADLGQQFVELRVAGSGQGRVLAVHPAAIVAHADQPAPAILDVHLDRRGTGIEGILHEFLHRRRRTLHHLAGSNLVCQSGIQ